MLDGINPCQLQLCPASDAWNVGPPAPNWSCTPVAAPVAAPGAPVTEPVTSTLRPTVAFAVGEAMATVSPPRFDAVAGAAMTVNGAKSVETASSPLLNGTYSAGRYCAAAPSRLPFTARSLAR